MVFELLDPRIVKVLKDKDIHEPTGPQKDAIPNILAGKHLLLVAPTGIGKTEAAMLPVLHRLITTPGRGIRCIYVTPLRALNRDMLRRMTEFGEALNLDVAVRHGDTPQAERQRQSRSAPDILITTPETLQILFTGKNLRSHLKNVRYFVVDEIHELANDERGAQMSVAMERLVDIAGEYQRIGLSATVGSMEEVARFLGGRREVTVIKANVAKEMHIKVLCPEITDRDRDLAGTLQCDPELAASMRLCREVIDKHTSTLLFVNTRDTAEGLAARYHLWDEGFKVGVHHGSLSKEVRVQMEEDFKGEALKGLICTSSLELGIDIGTADYALQFNSPRQTARLIQRMGRAGHHVGARSDGAIVAYDPDEIAEGMVVIRRSLEERIEPLVVRRNPLAVLANQLVAMAMSAPQVGLDDAHRALLRSYPFLDLRREELEAVLRQLGQIGLVFINGNEFKRSGRGRNYFYDNISMIPDERTFLVRDISSRAVVGTLDESFVISFAEPYATFITRGRSWRIVEMGDEELLVEQVRDIGSIPSWSGEDLPVPYEVAQEVGRLRRERDLTRYSRNAEAERVLRHRLEEQEKAHPMPTDDVVTVESGKGVVIINACFGSMVNETFAKILSALLSARLGETVGVTSDPYRIILELPREVRLHDVVETMRSIKSEGVEPLIRLVMKNSSHLRWKFVFVAKKFGAVEKDADYREVNFNRLLEAYEGTPMFEEAVRKVLWEDMDLEGTRDVVRRMEQGTIQFRITSLSPIGRAGLERSKEMMTPQRADHSILMALKKRLEEEQMHMTCLNCKAQWRLRVREAKKHVVCDRCGGSMVAALSNYNKGSVDLLSKKKLTDEEKKEVRRVFKNADLVRNHGRKALLALAGRGVGADTAGRIISSYHEGEDDLLRNILAAEINYAKTKRFWD
jgi:ATP-dependent Lhr-like helicase